MPQQILNLPVAQWLPPWPWPQPQGFLTVGLTAQQGSRIPVKTWEVWSSSENPTYGLCNWTTKENGF